jgi:hypothetical protein
MKGQMKQSWSAAEIFPLILLGLVGLNVTLAATTLPISSTPVPRVPRTSPAKPPPANRVMLAEMTVVETARG